MKNAAKKVKLKQELESLQLDLQIYNEARNLLESQRRLVNEANEFCKILNRKSVFVLVYPRDRAQSSVKEWSKDSHARSTKEKLFDDTLLPRRDRELVRQNTSSQEDCFTREPPVGTASAISCAVVREYVNVSVDGSDKDEVSNHLGEQPPAVSRGKAPHKAGLRKQHVTSQLPSSQEIHKTHSMAGFAAEHARLRLEVAKLRARSVIGAQTNSFSPARISAVSGGRNRDHPGSVGVSGSPLSASYLNEDIRLSIDNPTNTTATTAMTTTTTTTTTTPATAAETAVVDITAGMVDSQGPQLKSTGSRTAAVVAATSNSRKSDPAALVLDREAIINKLRGILDAVVASTGEALADISEIQSRGWNVL